MLCIFYRNSETSLPSKIHNLKNGCKPRATVERVGKGGGSREGDVEENFPKRAECLSAGTESSSGGESGCGVDLQAD